MKKSEIVFWTILSVGILGGAILWGGWYMSPWGCDARWDQPTEWSIAAGCRVEIEGVLIPETNVRAI